MAGRYRHTSHTTYDNKYHIVWITKYRKKILIDDTVTESAVRQYITDQGKKEEDEDKTFIVMS
jgi:REP element-mobilizing transposase RayT